MQLTCVLGAALLLMRPTAVAGALAALSMSGWPLLTVVPLAVAALAAFVAAMATCSCCGVAVLAAVDPVKL